MNTTTTNITSNHIDDFMEHKMKDTSVNHALFTLEAKL